MEFNRNIKEAPEVLKFLIKIVKHNFLPHFQILSPLLNIILFQT